MEIEGLVRVRIFVFEAKNENIWSIALISIMFIYSSFRDTLINVEKILESLRSKA